MTYVPDPGDRALLAQMVAAVMSATNAREPAEYDRMADAVLTALAAAGRLLPTGGQDRIEGGHDYFGKGVFPLPALAHETFGWTATHQRTVTEWPDGSSRVGPWVSVNEGSAK